MFPFLEFCRNTQKSLSEFFKDYSKLPDDPTNQISLRLFFIMDFLQTLILLLVKSSIFQVENHRNKTLFCIDPIIRFSDHLITKIPTCLKV